MFEIFSHPLVGTILGFLGILLATYFYFRSRRTSRLAYQFDEITLVGGMTATFPEEVEIRFSGATVPRVTAIRMVLWNAGNSSVNGSQIVASDPLRAELSGDGIILKVSPLKVSRQANSISLESRLGTGDPVRIDFDYLDPRDGIAFEVLHSGKKDALRICGTLREIPNGPRNYGRADWLRNRSPESKLGRWTTRKAAMYAMLLLGAITAALGIFQPQLGLLFPMLMGSNEGTPSSVRWVFVVFGIIYASLPSTALWVRRKRFPPSLEPPSNDIPDERVADANGLSIHSALYAYGDKFVDVTRALRQLLRDGHLTVKVGNQLGGDPCHGERKILTVEYTHGGRRLTKTVPERETLSLP